MKNLRKRICCLTLFAIMLLCTCTCTTQASSKTDKKLKAKFNSYKKIKSYNSPVINGVTYSMKNSTIYSSSSGKKKALIGGCIPDTGLTNGKVIYYTRGNKQSTTYAGVPTYKNMVVYQYTIETGTTTVVYRKTSDITFLIPFACDGRYLYLGSATQYGDVYWNFRVLDLKTGKSKFIDKDGGKIYIVNGKVLMSGEGFPHGGNLLLMNRNGSGMRLITKENVQDVKIKGKYIYYTELKYSWESRKCRCTLNGKNAKALEKWHGGVTQ